MITIPPPLDTFSAFSCSLYYFLIYRARDQWPFGTTRPTPVHQSCAFSDDSFHSFIHSFISSRFYLITQFVVLWPSFSCSDWLICRLKILDVSPCMSHGTDVLRWYVTNNALGNVATHYVQDVLQIITKPFSTMKYFVVLLEKKYWGVGWGGSTVVVCWTAGLQFERSILQQAHDS